MTDTSAAAAALAQPRGTIRGMPDIRAAATRWRRTWTEAWEALDVEPIVALYAPEVTFSTQPFREAYRGHDGVREYVTRTFGEEEAPRVWVSEPIVDGDRAAVSWWAALREEDGDATLAGTSVLRYDSDGLVIEQWDAWNVLPERRGPAVGLEPLRRRRHRTRHLSCRVHRW